VPTAKTQLPLNLTQEFKERKKEYILKNFFENKMALKQNQSSTFSQKFLIDN